MIHEVLIIDDDPSIHAMVGLNLGGNRTDWISAYDGETGIALAVERKPDLILLDVDMPSLDGYEVFRRLKSEPRTMGIPVLFLSAADSRHEKVFGLDLGAVDYVTKPFDPFELRARTQAALRAKKTVDQLASVTLTDEVTGLFNRAYLERQLPAALAQARRWGRRLACILVEIDHFDLIRSDLGRAGVEALQRNIGELLAQTCRAEDTVCRYKDGMFAVLAFCNDLNCSAELAGRLLEDVRSYGASRGNAPTRLTASCGAALSPLTWRHSLMQDAEDALCRARLKGGDCVATVGEEALTRCA